MSYSTLLLTLLLTGFGPAGWAQRTPDRRPMLAVKQFGEFLKRFYYEQTPDQRPLTMDSLRALYPRRAYLLSLFDARDGRLTTQPAYKRAVDAFVTDLAESTERPPDPYANVLAETPFRVLFRGQSDTLTARWRMVRIDKAHGWRLVGLTAPFLALSDDGKPDTAAVHVRKQDTTQTPDRPLTLPPGTHETSFLAFHHVVRQGQDLRLLLSDSLSHTATGRAFVRAVRRRELVLTETGRVSLFLRAGSGWVVRVDEFPRDDDNSGWLISDLYGPLSPSTLPAGLTFR